MNINEQYILSSIWLEKLTKYIRSYYKTIYLGSPLYILLNIMLCSSFQKGFGLNFWVIFIPMCLVSTSFCIYFPLKAIRRYKNIVETFEINDDHNINLVLIDGTVLSLSQYEIKDVLFKVGNTEKVAKSIIVGSSELSYTIIPEFYTQVPVFQPS